MKLVAIKEHHLYDKTFRKGNRFVGKCVAVYVQRDFAAKKLMSADPEKRYHNRVGLSVGKKTGQVAAELRRAFRHLGLRSET